MLKLIDTLRIVTAGKIYVENERARLTHRLSLIHEADDNIAEAAKIMQELQVRLFSLFKLEVMFGILRLRPTAPWTGKRRLSSSWSR